MRIDVGDRIAARAASLVGVPFRLRGRNVDAGLDCIGVVADALSCTEHVFDIPKDYTLRGGHDGRISRFFMRSCFGVVVGEAAQPGDILSLRPAIHQAHLAIDETSKLEVQLFSAGVEIAELATSVLSPVAPYFWLQDEFVRCGNVEGMGNGRYILSHFQRGCFDTEAAIHGHLPGDAFLLLEQDTARLIVEREFLNGDLVTAEALGLGDIATVSATTVVTARSTTPLSPVCGSAKRTDDGTFVINWSRRSRIDAGWRDGVDQLLVEGTELYRVVLLVAGIAVAEWVTNNSWLLTSPAEFSALSIPPGTALTFAVRQIGRHAQSVPLYITIP